MYQVFSCRVGDFAYFPARGGALHWDLSLLHYPLIHSSTITIASASGTAVIASEAGAWKEVVRDGIDGYTAPCGDVEATREKLALLLSDACDLEQMGQAGLQRVKDHYTIEREAQALCDFFKKLQAAR